jgi:hypothetical protein
MGYGLEEYSILSDVLEPSRNVQNIVLTAVALCSKHILFAYKLQDGINSPWTIKCMEQYIT